MVRTQKIALLNKYETRMDQLPKIITKDVRYRNPKHIVKIKILISQPSYGISV